MPDANVETAALAAIERTFPTLDEWSDRTRTVHLPVPGSELEADNSVFEPLPLSEVTWMSQCSHLVGRGHEPILAAPTRKRQDRPIGMPGGTSAHRHDRADRGMFGR
jgi:hypothetical protein